MTDRLDGRRSTIAVVPALARALAYTLAVGALAACARGTGGPGSGAESSRGAGRRLDCRLEHRGGGTARITCEGRRG